MEAIYVKEQLWEEIELPKTIDTLVVEVACSKDIDFGILDKKNLKVFYNSKSGNGFKSIKWFEEQKGLKRFEINLWSVADSCYLILWNAYSDNKVFVCYNWFAKQN